MYKLFIAYNKNDTDNELARAHSDEELANLLLDKGVRGSVMVIEYIAFERNADDSIPQEVLDADSLINVYENPEEYKKSIS